MKKKYRMIGMLLCLVMIFPLISPFSVFANGENFELYDDSTQNEPTLEDYLAGAVTPEEWYGTLNKDTVPEILGYEEAVSRAHVRRLYEEEGEDLNRLVFQNADGSKTVYLYDYPVKYIDENEIIQDITLDIKESSTKSGQFQTASGSAITTFSSRMDDGILLRGNQVSVSLVPQFARSVASAQIESLEEARLVDNKKVIYTYDAKTDIEYSLTYTGFKEDIVVKEYTGQTRYTFTLYTNGLKLVEEAGSFCLIDSNKTVKAVLGEIIIFTADEKNNTMGEMVAKTIVENQEYLLTIVVDEKWLADENTMYPIRIDPTVEICYDNNGDGAISDVTINSLQGSSGTSGSLFIGKRATYGISRVLMKFPGLNLSSLGSNVTITNATVTIRDLLGEVPAVTIDCHAFTGNVWSETTAEWSNVSPNSFQATPLSSRTVSHATGQTQNPIYRFGFDITSAVTGWKNGNLNKEKGIIFKATSSIENGSSNVHKTFASYNRSSYKPTLSVTYTSGDNLLDDVTYYLNNAYSGKYLRYSSSAGVGVQSGLISNLGDTIRWEVRSVTGGYTIRSKADSTKYLSVPSGSTSSSVVQVVTLSEGSVIPATCIWLVTGSSVGGTVIKNTSNNRYLITTGTSLSTSATATGSSTDLAYQSSWRMASISYYGNASSSTKRELQSGFSVNDLILNVNASGTPVINKSPDNALWATAADFQYTFVSGTANSVSFNFRSGLATSSKVGVATFIATHKVTNRTYSFSVYVDRYTYELVNLYGFNFEVAVLIRDLYNRIDSPYATESDAFKAWVASRVLSEFCFDGAVIYSGLFAIELWDDVAGSVTSENNRRTYFMGVLGYTAEQYDQISNAITGMYQTVSGGNSQFADFAHMQYALSARLAYTLKEEGIDLDGMLAVVPEDASYCGGWLGDAVISDVGGTTLKNDDYCADLDAENIFRDIAEGEKTFIEAANDYYNGLTENRTRADIFLEHIPYFTVQSKVFSYLGLISSTEANMNTLRNSYPDTYNFLLSLQNGLATMGTFA